MPISFLDLPLSRELLNLIDFPAPTLVQELAIPLVVEGRDVIATAPTGKGKTLGYALPAIERIKRNPETTVLVLLPTRELAMQVVREVRKFARPVGVDTGLLLGDMPIKPEYQMLQAGLDIVVGTPDRVLRHLEEGTLKLRQSIIIVVDEFDLMLMDKDLSRGVFRILSHMPPDRRQTLLFSATIPQDAGERAKTILKDPVRVDAGSGAAPQIRHTVVYSDNEGNKVNLLRRELRGVPGTVLVFVNTKRAAEKLAGRLNTEGFPANFLHGGMKQQWRNVTAENFRDENIPILVATDSFSRGQDIPHVRRVINLELPDLDTVQAYNHRAGRTARAGAEGQVVTLLAPEDAPKWRLICESTKITFDVQERVEKVGERRHGYRRKRRSETSAEP